jgi:hypothetical protein
MYRGYFCVLGMNAPQLEMDPQSSPGTHPSCSPNPDFAFREVEKKKTWCFVCLPAKRVMQVAFNSRNGKY